MWQETAGVTPGRTQQQDGGKRAESHAWLEEEGPPRAAMAAFCGLAGVSGRCVRIFAEPGRWTDLAGPSFESTLVFIGDHALRDVS